MSIPAIEPGGFVPFVAPDASPTAATAPETARGVHIARKITHGVDRRQFGTDLIACPPCGRPSSRRPWDSTTWWTARSASRF